MIEFAVFFFQKAIIIDVYETGFYMSFTYKHELYSDMGDRYYNIQHYQVRLDGEGRMLRFLVILPSPWWV